MVQVTSCQVASLDNQSQTNRESGDGVEGDLV